MTELRKQTLYDAAGNAIDSHLSADGGYHLGTAIQQAITTSTNNSTETNLDAAATFTGTADEALGSCAIQVFHASDKECTIYIDQSIENTFADATQIVTDSFTCLANEPCSRVFYSIAPYYRMRVTNNGSSITTKLATFTGMTPVINPMPRKLSTKGNLQVVSSLRGDENYERHVWVNPTNEIAVSPVYRLAGAAFEGATVDANFWAAVGTDGGTATQADGVFTLAVAATADSLASLTSVRKARFVAGSAQLFSCGANWVTAGTANNIRRIGAYSTTDGYFFQKDGDVFSVGSRAGGAADALVTTFNGNIGPSWAPEDDTYYKLSIEYTPLGVFYYVDGRLLHKISKTAGLSETQTLPIKMENINDGEVAIISFKAIGLYIARQGELTTNPTSYYHALGTEAGTNLKIGAGTLRGIIISNCVKDAVITLADSITAITPTIWTFTSGKLFELPTTINFYGLPFSNGLRLYVTVQNACVTVIYE